MRRTPFLALALVGCSPALDVDRSPYPSADRLGGPSFLQPTSEDVDGRACAWTPDGWRDDARALLEARFASIAPLTLDGRRFSTAADVLDALDGDDLRAERVAFELNRRSNAAGWYGKYARFGSAWRTGGAWVGLTPDQIAAGAGPRTKGDLLDLLRAFDSGFSACESTEHLDASADADGDGVTSKRDCDDTDATIGKSIVRTPLGESDLLVSPEQLPDDWTQSDGSWSVGTGGQHALLGMLDKVEDVYLAATVGANGAGVGCGFDCNVCGAYEPEDCYTDYQALALGILTVESSSGAHLVVSNSGDYDVCLQGFGMWQADSSQNVVVGEAVDTATTFRIGAKSSLELSYGSWTTDNGTWSPDLGDPPFWCYQNGTTFTSGVSYTSIGAWLPEDMQAFIEDDSDTDGDGVEDHVDWLSSGTWANMGVQAQANIWDHQATHAALAIGKLAASTTSGTVQVDLEVQNRGAVAAAGTVTDTVPAFWAVESCTSTPSETANADGTTTLTWDVELDGCTDGCATVDTETITCQLRSTVGSDRDIVELPAASVAYNDGDDDETSWSMAAAAFDYDWDSDAQVLCGNTERWRVGLLARATLDSDQDEGFHGYRCAIARNDESRDCATPGYFLQLAEFRDAEEDEVKSECEGSCSDPSFTQLARTDADESFDLVEGASVQLRLWAFDDELYCQAITEDGTIWTASAVDTSFSGGTVGLSTMHAFGTFDDLQACESLAAIPGA